MERKGHDPDSWPTPPGYPARGLIEVCQQIRKKREGLPRSLVKPTALISLALSMLLAGAFFMWL